MDREVKIKVGEVIYDVENKTYLTGRARADEKNYVSVANMQLNDDAENRNQVIRTIETALAELSVLMSQYLKTGYEPVDNQLDAKLDEKEIKFEFMLPANYDMLAGEALGAAMHDYLVARATGDWFAITNKPDAERYVALAKEISDRIVRILSKRKRPER